MDKATIRTHVDRLWEGSVVSELIEYIRTPNTPVAFDRDWQAHGHMDRVVARFENWARRQPLKGMTVEVVRLAGPTPLLIAEMYGRGRRDAGYAMFACLGAIGALQVNSIPHARCVVVIEACEESGSFDLPHYVDHLADRIGSASLVVCLDSGCGHYA